MILDTSYLIDLFRGEESAVAIAGEIEEEPLATTAISVFEIYQGVKDNELASIKGLFSSMNVHPLDEDAAAQAGLLQKRLKRDGKAIDPEDCMIAAIALQHDKALLTRNKKHFARIPGLRVRTY